MPTVHAQDTTPLDKVSKPNLKIGIVYLRRFLNLKLRAPRVIFLIKKSNFLRKNLNSTTQKNDSHPKTALNQNKNICLTVFPATHDQKGWKFASKIPFFRHTLQGGYIIYINTKNITIWLYSSCTCGLKVVLKNTLSSFWDRKVFSFIPLALTITNPCRNLI